MSIRRLIVFGAAAALVAALVATLAPSGADARAGSARAGAARFAPPTQGIDLRMRFNRALALRLRLHCGGRPIRWRCR